MTKPTQTQIERNWRKFGLLLTLLLVCVFFFNISLGSVHIPFKNLLAFLTGSGTGKASWDIILLNFRLPKAITAVLVGGALGISGLQMQTLFRNPLAGPYVLGISSGAGLGVALAIFGGIYLGGFLELTGIGRSWLMVVSGGIGAFTLLFIIALAARKLHDSVTLLIIGLMFGTAAGALVSIMQFFSQAENIQAYVIWSFGTLGSLSWNELSVFIPVIIAGFVMAILLSKPLNSLLLGESYARSLGVNIKKTRLLIILNTSILAGTVTAFCGPIAFLGIALPHIARMLFHTTHHLILVPMIILFGGTLMLLFDLLAQLPGLEATLPINAVTSLFGAPFVIYLLVKQKTFSQNFR